MQNANWFTPNAARELCLKETRKDQTIGQILVQQQQAAS
jgi:hypothetical protein